MVFQDDGWIAGRGANKSDVYLFGYGLEYRAALKAFFAVSGPPPLIPRWSLGNWWSRYCEFMEMADLKKSLCVEDGAEMSDTRYRDCIEA
jgi:hypothetical protein